MKEVQKKSSNISIHSGSFFDLRKGSIVLKNGQEYFLEHRLKDFFTILLQNKNDVVTRAELMNFVWGDIVVNEESVTKAAYDLRKFFELHQLTGVRLITISKLGYKLEVGKNEEPKSQKYLRRALKTIGYALAAAAILIILIRAARY